MNGSNPMLTEIQPLDTMQPDELRRYRRHLHSCWRDTPPHTFSPLGVGILALILALTLYLVN